MTTGNERRPDSPSPTNQRNALAADATQASTQDSRYPGKTLEDNNTIRLVEIFPGSDDEPVRCALFNVRLEDSTRPEYEALSYHWGNPTARREIELYNSLDVLDGAKVCFLVPENCFSALKRLRRRTRHCTSDKNPIFWIDSICIDQNCISERNHQLSLMRSIYSSASRVTIDLGSEFDGSAAFMYWISDLHAPSDYAAQFVQPSRETIRNFFTRPWFRRVWVLQEAMLAREIVAICGDQEVSWEAFKTFKNYDQGKTVRPLPYVLKDSASKWIENVEMDEEKISRRLFNCLRESRGCEATDPRDKVYALLPLLMGNFLSQGKYKPLVEPDYSRTMTQIYTDLACKFLNTPGIGLGLLRAVFPSSNTSDLPSWVPDWSMKPCFSYMLCDHGNSGTDHTFLATSLEEEMDLANPLSNRGQQTWHVDPAMGGLFVSIASLGYITRLTSPASISLNELPLGRWKTILPRWCLVRSDDTSQPRRLIVQPGLEDYALDQMLNRCELSPFTRILVKDRIVYPDCIQKAEGRITSFEHEIPRRSSMDVTRSETKVDEDPTTRPTQWQTYWEEVHSRGRDKERVQGSLAGLFSMSMGSDHVSAIRILDSCDGRRMAVIGGEWLALVPIESRESDWIGFIRGIKTPMVMRYLEDNSEHQGYRKARLVGECFVLNVTGKGAVVGAAANCLKKIVII